jgi:hypothetical protein
MAVSIRVIMYVRNETQLGVDHVRLGEVRCGQVASNKLCVAERVGGCPKKSYGWVLDLMVGCLSRRCDWK